MKTFIRIVALGIVAVSCAKRPVGPNFNNSGQSANTEQKQTTNPSGGIVPPNSDDPTQVEQTPVAQNPADPENPVTPGQMPANPQQPQMPAGDVKSSFVEKRIQSFADVGQRTNVRTENGVIITEGVIRMRRRHENDMDFAKFNPFYWEGRGARFKIEDFTGLGQKHIRATLETDSVQNYIPTRGPDFSAIYKGDPNAPDETMRSKFALNMRMTHVKDFKVFEANLNEGEFNAFPDKLKKGEVFMFEMRFFLDEAQDLWKKQKAANPATLSAYYSEFFRVKIGEGGLLIDDYNDAHAMPPPIRHSGGWTTPQMMKVEPWRALQQQALNMSFTNDPKFLLGRTFFHTDFVEGNHKGDEADDKPSVFYPEDKADRAGYASNAFNARSCNGCHINNGISLPPEPGKTTDHIVVRTYDKTTGTEHKNFGGQLQTVGDHAEGTLSLGTYEMSQVKLGDGTVVNLKRPVYEVRSDLKRDNLGLSVRRPLAIIGVGLLNAVPDATIKSLVGRQGGQVSMVNGKVGRFGWKAEKSTLNEQIGFALRSDLGVRNAVFPKTDCANDCSDGKGVLSQERVDLIETYISLLGVPPRNNPADEKVKKGEALFRSLGCANCHIPTLQTGDSKFAELKNQSIQPFTDLLLHNMGPGLADESGAPNAALWRTAPLWGLKNVKHATQNHTDLFPPANINILWQDTHREADKNPTALLHDGRASTVSEAILWHGGEAAGMAAGYKALNKADREALEAFLWDI